MRLLEVTATDHGKPSSDTTWGWGDINAYAAAEAALELK